MSSIDKSAIEAALKELYAGQSVQDLVYNKSQRPLLSMLKKNTSFAGSLYPLPVVYEDVGGRSYDFTKAQGNVSASKITQFQIDTVKNYAIARITTDALMRSRTDKGAFLNGLKHMVDSAINRLSNDIEASLFRDGSGSIGTVVTAASNPMTLGDVEDVVNFWVGQKLVFANDTASALTSGTALTVTKVNRDNGEVTLSAAASTLGVGDGEYIFNEGDYDSASDKNKITGLEGWLPATVTDSFFGVSRTVDPTRLGGIRYAGSSAAIEESIVGAAARLGRESGAIPNIALMNFTTFRRLVNEMGSKVQRSEGSSAKGGFQMLEIYGPKGLIKCVPASFAQADRIWLLTSDSWQLISMGEAVQILDQDGSKVLRVSDADALEVRIGSFAQLACDAPGKNARITL